MEYIYNDNLKLNLQLFADSADKTETATPKRRNEARKKGQVAKSQDLAQIGTLLGGVIILNVAARNLYERMYTEFANHFGNLNIGVLTIEIFKENMLKFSTLFFMVITPILSTVLVIGVLVNYLQVGFLFTIDPIKPNFEKISPLKGLKQLFSMKKLVELIKTLLKLAIISYYSYLVLKNNIEDYLRLPYDDVMKGFIYIFGIIYSTIIKITAGLFVVAILDYIYQKIEFEKSIKMSKQEVKDEYKQTEGDPQIKGKIKQMQRELLKKKMIEDVPKATVVITNPTHISIALKYERGMGAPEVVAKGVDHMAKRIREIAKENEIPLMENKPLARAMYPLVEVGDEIPEEFYQAVAEILAIILD
jgi:flagellar biosynthetic protein FlhB